MWMAFEVAPPLEHWTPGLRTILPERVVERPLALSICHELHPEIPNSLSCTELSQKGMNSTLKLSLELHFQELLRAAVCMRNRSLLAIIVNTLGRGITSRCKRGEENGIGD